MSTEAIIAIIGALTTALSALIPLYFRERTKARVAEQQRDTVIDGLESAGDGPISRQIKATIKKTAMARGIDQTLSEIVEERTKK